MDCGVRRAVTTESHDNANTDWIDGYYQELPRGPAPSAGESQYLYRTLAVATSEDLKKDRDGMQ